MKLPIALAIRFALEICLVAVAAWFPLQADIATTRLALSLGSVIVLLLIWGTLLSPKRRVEIGGPPRFILEFALFGLATAALFTRGHWELALTLMGFWLFDKSALLLLEHRL